MPISSREGETKEKRNGRKKKKRQEKIKEKSKTKKQRRYFNVISISLATFA